jgi:alkanesulfonate monooxygenase SsuD/methylene tetrahydromethanopterin reductase-like flavin-dependent oxidoreductase (luciferase family)
MVATLDQLAGGRVIHFPDGGHNRREHVAYGLAWTDDQDERIERFAEALALTVALWRSGPDGPVDFFGKHYRVEEAVCAPSPVQRPHPPIWLGEAHPAMLDLCARFGDGWNSTPVSLAELRQRLAMLRAACDRHKRPYDELEKSLEIQVLIAPDRAALRERVRRMVAIAPSDEVPDAELAAYVAGETEDLPATIAETWLAGTADEVAARIGDYAAEGVGHFLLWFVDCPDETGMRLFAERVMPRFQITA